MSQEVDARQGGLGPRGTLEVADDRQVSGVGLLHREPELIGPDAGVELDEVDAGIRLAP